MCQHSVSRQSVIIDTGQWPGTGTRAAKQAKSQMEQHSHTHVLSKACTCTGTCKDVEHLWLGHVTCRAILHVHHPGKLVRTWSSIVHVIEGYSGTSRVKVKNQGSSSRLLGPLWMYAKIMSHLFFISSYSYFTPNIARKLKMSSWIMKTLLRTFSFMGCLF